jgi:hypothetical protein
VKILFIKKKKKGMGQGMGKSDGEERRKGSKWERKGKVVADVEVEGRGNGRICLAVSNVDMKENLLGMGPDVVELSG